MSTPESAKQRPPVPRYGEYADLPPVPAADPSVGGANQPVETGERPPRTGDLIASVILLVLGFFGVAIAIFNALTISLQMQQVYEQYGVEGDYEPGPGVAVAGAVIVISHVVLYALAVIVTIALVRKRRLSFWMPLSAGVLAFVIMIITFIALAFADPALVDAMMKQQGL